MYAKHTFCRVFTESTENAHLCASQQTTLDFVAWLKGLGHVIAFGAFGSGDFGEALLEIRVVWLIGGIELFDLVLFHDFVDDFLGFENEVDIFIAFINRLCLFPTVGDTINHLNELFGDLGDSLSFDFFDFPT